MVSQWYQAIVTAVLVTVLPVTDQGLSEPMNQIGVTVGDMVGQVMKKYLISCHLVLMTTTQHSPVFSSILRSMSASSEGVLLVNGGSLLSLNKLFQDHLLQGLWGDTRTTCRALILDLTTNKNTTHLIFRLLESSGLWQRPETRVVAIGGKARKETFLLHTCLRNTIHAVYLAIHDLTPRTPPRNVSDRVWVYRRCLYCDNGEADVQFVYFWNPISVAKHTRDIFQDQLQFMGHKFRVVTVPFVPYMDFERDTDEPGTTVTPKDSLDARLLHTITKALNFTIEIREEPSRSWGREEDGMFSGLIGQLQREEADFSTVTGPTPERLRVIQHLKGYPSDTMTVVSRKPSLLPKHLSLLRPFVEKLWLALVVSVGAWGGILWLLQKAWSWVVVGGRVVRFDIALQYSWGALLEQPPTDPSINMTGRVLVGWWLLFCLIIDTAYRSSLIAHMTVQGKTRPPDTLEDLVERDGWKWGTEPWILRGYPYEYLSKHTDPVVQKAYKEMEVLVVEKALKKVLAGEYSLFDFKNYIATYIATHHSDTYGNTPFHISKKGISIVASFGWSFRKGAPFYLKFGQIMSRLEDGGIISYWTKDVIARRVRGNREARELNPSSSQEITLQDSSQMVLGLQHIQGAFYLLLLGSTVAFLTLLEENLAHFCSKHK